MTNEIVQGIITVISTMGAIISLVIGVTKHKIISLKIASAFLIIVGVVVFMGYVTDSPSVYTFPPNKIGMALPTGLCFFITGMCLWVIIDSVNFKK